MTTKIKIEKVTNGVRLTISTDPNAPPQEMTLDRTEAESVATMLHVALKADKFQFELETRY